jgi:hypothetical protein
VTYGYEEEEEKDKKTKENTASKELEDLIKKVKSMTTKKPVTEEKPPLEHPKWVETSGVNVERPGFTHGFQIDVKEDKEDREMFRKKTLEEIHAEVDNLRKVKDRLVEKDKVLSEKEQLQKEIRDIKLKHTLGKGFLGKVTGVGQDKEGKEERSKSMNKRMDKMDDALGRVFGNEVISESDARRKRKDLEDIYNHILDD